jgi:ribonuclease P protein component
MYVFFSREDKERNGSNLSSAKSSADQQAGISRAYENGMGSCRSVTPPQEGSQAPHGPAALEASGPRGPLTGERIPRAARLTRGADLKACWDEGRRRHLPHLELAWRKNDTGHARMGVIVPRFHHTAVARNRLRRRIREIMRRGPLATLPAVDLLVRARRSAYGASFDALEAELTENVSQIT